MNVFGRLFNWLVLPFTQSVARRVTDAWDTAALLTGSDVTSSSLINALDQKRRGQLKLADVVNTAADEEVARVTKVRDNLTRGLNDWVDRTQAQANEVHEMADGIKAEAAEMAALQHVLRNGQ